MIQISVQKESPREPDIVALLNAHSTDMHKYSPVESVHTLDVDALCQDNVHFWTARADNQLLSCGAMVVFEPNHGEIKSMRTADEHRRKGSAALLLQTMIEFASADGIRRISLETGTATAFLPAKALYERFGFVECPPFADYVLDPYSIFMTRENLP